MESGKLPCGYDDVFLSAFDEDFQCRICDLPLREPVLTRCGHRFCRQCLEQYMLRFVLSFIRIFSPVRYERNLEIKTIRRYQYSSQIMSENCLDFYMIIVQVVPEAFHWGIIKLQ